jgi:hypothetical protein
LNDGNGRVITEHELEGHKNTVVYSKLPQRTFRAKKRGERRTETWSSEPSSVLTAVFDLCRQPGGEVGGLVERDNPFGKGVVSR